MASGIDTMSYLTGTALLYVIDHPEFCLLVCLGAMAAQECKEDNLRAQYFVALPHVSLLKLPRQKNSCRHKQFLYEFMTRNNVGCRKSFNQRRRKQIITVHETLPPGNTKRQRTNEKRECDVRKEKIAMSRSSSKELETQTNAQWIEQLFYTMWSESVCLECLTWQTSIGLSMSKIM